MSLKHFLNFLIFFVTLTTSGRCQICTKQSMETTTKQISYTFTYSESYRTKCWYKESCLKTRTRLSKTFKTVPSTHMITVQECCPGYFREDTDNNTLSCKPICVPACINGECRNPGECSCFEGYSPGPIFIHQCLPVCDKECVHGSCIAPQTCSCGFGYSSFNSTCQPICTEPCENSVCTAPDTCECHPGYREINGTCEPYCSRGCTHGVCIEPEECQCDPGYKEKDDQCIPTCEPVCGNGTCVGPNICRCDPGFEYHGDTCEPVCNKSCGSGKCVGSDICECKPGYDFQNGTCQAICTNCTNGDCVEPNICKCHPGYANNSNTCAPVCKNCEGTCIAPNHCMCELPLVPQNKTASDEDCDCFEYCTDVSKQCEKTICFDPYTSHVIHEKETIHYQDTGDEERYDDEDDENSAEDYNEFIQKYGGSTRSYIDSSNNDSSQLIAEKNRKRDDNWFWSIGIYVIIGVIVLLSLIFLGTWVFIKKVFTGGSYRIEDDHKTNCSTTQSVELQSPSTEEV